MTENATDHRLEGIAAARAGQTADAQRLLRRATELVPTDAEAWAWRASVAENDADRRAFLEEALRHDPAHEEAKRALARLDAQAPATVDEDEPTFCAVHPTRETALRCNRCGRLMCTDCAVRHPVGLRCRECVNDTKSPIYKVGAGSAGLAFLASLVISNIVAVLIMMFGGAVWFIFWFFVAPAIGAAIGNAVQRIVRRKRGRPMQIAVVAGLVVGTVVAALGLGLVLGGNPLMGLGQLTQIHTLLFLGLGGAAAFTALR